MIDERFHTPRATANSSRSAGSQSYQGSECDGTTSSCNDRWHTPRASVTSSRSAASFASARSVDDSPIDSMMEVHRNSDNRRYSHSSGKDRTIDFRSVRRASGIGKTTAYQGNCDLAANGGPLEADSRVKADARISRDIRNQDIFSLARHGRVGEVEELLLQGVSIESKDKNGNSILSIGSQNGSRRIVKLALRYGADIDASNDSGNTPLHFAFKYGFGTTLGTYLMSKGANKSLRNNDGKTYSEV